LISGKTIIETTWNHEESYKMVFAIIDVKFAGFSLKKLVFGNGFQL